MNTAAAAQVNSTGLAALAERITASGWTLYFEVTPLFEEYWTGIPVVAAGLGQALLTLLPANTVFFRRHDIVSTEAVRDAFARESGLYLARNFDQGHARLGHVPLPALGAPAAGIYPSVKPVHSLFAVECSIYHDISTLLLPQYHTPANISHHLTQMADDLRTNRLTFGVSQATADDLVCYLGASGDEVSIARNGVSWPWWFPVQLKNEPPANSGVPYFMVLGTREPRKNLVRVFEALEIFPEIVERAQILFVGANGWLWERQSVPKIVEELVAARKIVFTGYLSSFEKYRLLAGAEASIYSSLFEGFGLPVLESLSVGTPCIASWSSAIPEVGQDACFYFDPLSAEDLGLAIQRVQRSNPKGSAVYAELCKSISAEFTWPAMLEGILSRLVPALAAAEHSGRNASTRDTDPVRRSRSRLPRAG